jgi:S-adenosylmethionine:tRNA ribosyltransferase-isomerase
MRLVLAAGEISGEVKGQVSGGRVRVRLTSARPLRDVLEEHGVPPVPPYIRREPGDSRTDRDRRRYQTVYAREAGAVAAPTAGLHFTPELLEALRRKGVASAALTLHVGPGTFRPVKADRVEDHAMEAERYAVPEETAGSIRRARAAGGRIAAVGTTTVRTLETVARADGEVAAGSGRSSLFITPPFDFRVVDVLLTNFHLPRSTLLMMVSAFAGRDFVLEAYRAAVGQRYRFYSYGDCMLIL